MEWEHMWNVYSHLDGRKYESGDIPCMSNFRANKTKIWDIAGGRVVGATLVLNYDYRSTFKIKMQLKSVESFLAEDVEKSYFPRRAPCDGQMTFVPYDPLTAVGEEAANVDEMFPELSRFCFEDGFDASLELFLFQPGRKKIQAFITKFYNGCKHMIHVPEKFSSIEEMFYAISTSCRVDKPNFYYNWWGVNLFPPEARSTSRFLKYQEADENMTTFARECPPTDRIRLADRFLRTFPKCAAAAGYNQKNKPSKAAERGWIVYRNGTLMLCRGSSKSRYSNAPSPGVWDGNNKHEPMDDSAIVGKISIKITSLQELFCAVEALC